MNPSELKFLVVDDDPLLCDLTYIVLAGLGYSHTDKAVDGLAALEKLRAGRYDCVISDINMPRMSGLELLMAIRADPVLRHLPVILATANPQSQYLATAMKQGVSGFLVKPFGEAVLGEAIRKALADPSRPSD